MRKYTQFAAVGFWLLLTQSTTQATVGPFRPVEFYIDPPKALTYRLNALPMESFVYTGVTGGTYTFNGSYQFLVALECTCFGAGAKPHLNVTSSNPHIVSVDQVEPSNVLRFGPKIFAFLVTLRTPAVMDGFPKPKTGTAEIILTGVPSGSGDSDYTDVRKLSFTTLPANSTLPAMKAPTPSS